MENNIDDKDNNRVVIDAALQLVIWEKMGGCCQPSAILTETRTSA